MTFKENGDCGIGTTSPTAKFDVQGNMRISDLATTEAGTNNLIQVGENGILTPISTTAAGIGLWQQSPTNINDIINANLGKVGIGTNNPEATLHVLSNCENSGTTLRLQYNYTPPIQNGCTSGISLWDIAALPDNILTFTNPTLIQPAITILKDGNVGIGTNSPATKLDIQGGWVRIGDANSNGIQLETQSGFHRIAFRDLRFYDWDTGGDMVTFNNGNVGIGTTSPYDKLHVASGNIRLDSEYELYFTDNGQIRSSDNNHRILFRRDENKLEFREFGDIIFSTNVTDGNENAKMVILANGNVGIGTSSTCPPSEKLAVNGKIHVQDEIIIDNNGWCDYVYSPEYKFLTIPELEKYLLKYKHMPGVKSASEMEKSGFTVLETNKQMMEKIEELSLYIIQLEKRISELEKK